MIDERFVDVIEALKVGTANDIVPWKPKFNDPGSNSYSAVMGDWCYEVAELATGDIALNLLSCKGERLDGCTSSKEDARHKDVEGLYLAAQERHASHAAASLKAAAREIKRRLKEAGLFMPVSAELQTTAF